ncbi:MAG: CDP-glycerol glycerophosphotransferase family protein, partial [Oscillospiraceae bacterium]|nr:CDP-glycerol glycerophosphotransferase family protein [Oscillospiraceae bacterium]
AKKPKSEIKKVVFMVHYIPSWIRHELIYKELCESDKAEAYILCVPSDINEKDPAKNDIYNYFKERGYDVINAINEDGSLFDLKALAPDFVFQSRPYNARMPEQYKSEVISSYAKLCNISYGPCLTQNGLPTVLNKDYIKDVTLYFTETQDSKLYFEKSNKLGVLTGVQEAKLVGAANLEQMYIDREKAQDHFPSLVSRPRFIWAPRWSVDPVLGGSNFFRYKDFLLKYFGENQNVSLLMRPHPLMFSNFVENGNMTKEEELEYRRKISETPNIELDEMKEYADNFWMSDALITDISAIIIDYYITGKPIIYCTSDIKLEVIDQMKEMLGGCYVANNQEDIQKYIEMLARGEDPLKEERARVAKKYFESSLNGCGKRIADILINA